MNKNGRREVFKTILKKEMNRGRWCRSNAKERKWLVVGETLIRWKLLLKSGIVDRDSSLWKVLNWK